MIAIAVLGLLPLIPRSPAAFQPVRALTGPVIGSAPVISTSILMLIAAGALAATLWQAPAFSVSADHPPTSTTPAGGAAVTLTQ
jgi:hypothetical protein